MPADDAESSDASSGSQNSSSGASQNCTSDAEYPEDRYYTPAFPPELGKILGLHQARPQAGPPEPPLLVNRPRNHGDGPADVAYKGGRLDALREISQYWESLKDLSTAQVLHEYKALIWWWNRNQKTTPGHLNCADERHYQRLADLICVKSILLMKGLKVDLQNLENYGDLTQMAPSQSTETATGLRQRIAASLNS